MLVGEDIATKAWNLHRTLEDGRVTLIATVEDEEPGGFHNPLRTEEDRDAGA